MIDERKINFEKLEERAEEIRELLIKTVSKTGGHLAPNLGIVELTLALHEIFDFSKDKILFDVGHQSYVYKILTGRENRFSTLRQRGGLAPFTDPSESYYDHFISGHAGTALSAACGLAKANPGSKIVVIIGDASIANGHSLEALNNMSEDCKNIIVILNDNEMSIGKNVGALSNFLGKVMVSDGYKNLKKDIRYLINNGNIGKKITGILERAEESVKYFLSPLSISEMLGFKFFGTLDGHNLPELTNYLSKAKTEEGPIFLHVKTQKGKGYSFAEEDAEKFHGVSPFDFETGKIGRQSEESYSAVFGKKIVEMGERDSEIMVVSAAMIKGVGAGEFFEKYPERCKDVGMAEGHGVTYCAGLAMAGKKPYFAIYSTFLQRGYSQLIHDISLQKISVKFIVDRAGIVGEDGKTHNGLYDIAMFTQIPNFMVFAPTTGQELEEILEITKDIKDKSVMIRYPREFSYNYKYPQKFKIGKWREVKKGENSLFITTGSMFKEVLEINEHLEDIGIKGTILSAASIKPLDEQYIIEEFFKYKNIFVFEEAYEKGSFGSEILEFLNRKNIMKKIHLIALNNNAIPHGSRDILMRENGLRGGELIDRIKGCIDVQ
ncbi:MAG: 1-deoxy-D-xylulose-5-phosphate synthase [Fusobacteriaceae bacterium]